MRLVILLLTLTLSGCVSQAAFKEYQDQVFETHKNMLKLHKYALDMATSHEDRLFKEEMAAKNRDVRTTSLETRVGQLEVQGQTREVTQ